jgi:hypothetical protein
MIGLVSKSREWYSSCSNVECQIAFSMSVFLCVFVIFYIFFVMQFCSLCRGLCSLGAQINFCSYAVEFVYLM